MRVLLLVALLTGCESAPPLIGEMHEGELFTLRLTRFDGNTALPGVLRALAGRGVNVDGCQVSSRGEPSPRFTATLSTGECTVELKAHEEPEPEFALDDEVFL